MSVLKVSLEGYNIIVTRCCIMSRFFYWIILHQIFNNKIMQKKEQSNVPQSSVQITKILIKR